MMFSKFYRSNLCVTTIIIMIQLSIFHAYADSPEITIDYPESVGIGRSFDVNLNLNNSIDITALMLEVDYNEDFLSLKDVLSNTGDEVDFFVENGIANVIYLSPDSIEAGNFLTLQFTAKTGNDSSIQEISFTCLQAVDSNINDVDLSLSESINVEIIKANNSQNNETTKRSVQSDKSNSSKSKSVSSKTTSSKKSNSVTENNERLYPETQSSCENPESMFLSSDYEVTSGIELVNDSDLKIKYVLAGVGLASGFFIMIFVAFRFGQASMEKNSVDDNKKNLKQDDETEEDNNIAGP